MTLNKIMNAWNALERLMQQSNSYKMAYSLTKIKKELESNVDFYRDKERELIETYAERDEKGEVVISDKGEFRVADTNISEFVSKHNELNSVEVDIEPYKIDDCPQTISGADLEALEGIIEFKEPD